MSRACTSSDRDAWSHTICCLILAFVCYCLPYSVFAATVPSADGGPVLRIQGSNTIGARLAPALVKGLFEEQGLHNIRIEPGDSQNEQSITARTADAHEIRITVAAHGSGTGFTALANGSADLAASSRPIKDKETDALKAVGDMQSAAAEQIIALDGLAIILHPYNPLTSLNTAELAKVFAGEITDWSQLGAHPGTISVYARDKKSGTFDTFNELVLNANGKSLADNAQRFESSETLSDAVSQDINGIGFIGLPYIRAAKALAIASGDSRPMLPSQNLIATEDYPLSRRLFIYKPPHKDNIWAQALIDFTQSPRGQAIVEQNGFIAQTVHATNIQAQPEMPATYQELVENAQRLSVNFRFQEGSASLDNKAKRDLKRLNDYLKANNKMAGNVVLVGFGDTKSDHRRAELLSKLRALAVRRELQRSGVYVRDFIGLGDGLPVASNQAEDDRIKNRRVEVWVY